MSCNVDYCFRAPPAHEFSAVLDLLWLAFGAEVAPTMADGEALDGGAADRAGLPPAVGNLKLQVGGALFTIRAEVGIYTCPFIVDG